MCRGYCDNITQYLYYKLKESRFSYPSGNFIVCIYYLPTHTMKIEKDKFNSLSEKDQNLQLLKVSMNVLFPFI